MKYWNRIQEWLFPVLLIAKKKRRKKKKMQTDPRFFWHVTVNTHIFISINSLTFTLLGFTGNDILVPFQLEHVVSMLILQKYEGGRGGKWKLQFISKDGNILFSTRLAGRTKKRPGQPKAAWDRPGTGILFKSNFCQNYIRVTRI